METSNLKQTKKCNNLPNKVGPFPTVIPLALNIPHSTNKVGVHTQTHSTVILPDIKALTLS